MSVESLCKLCGGCGGVND